MILIRSSFYQLLQWQFGFYRVLDYALFSSCSTLLYEGIMKRVI